MDKERTFGNIQITKKETFASLFESNKFIVKIEERNKF